MLEGDGCQQQREGHGHAVGKLLGRDEEHRQGDEDQHEVVEGDVPQVVVPEEGGRAERVRRMIRSERAQGRGRPAVRGGGAESRAPARLASEQDLGIQLLIDRPRVARGAL